MVTALGAIQRSHTQVRILRTALDLFAEHGVSGTSLQMIADAIGVTKAAIYHQFNTKNEIVVAVIEMEFAEIEAALEGFRASGVGPLNRDALLRQVIQIAVDRRQWVRVFQSDPVIVRLIGDQPQLQGLIDDLYAAILG